MLTGLQNLLVSIFEVRESKAAKGGNVLPQSGKGRGGMDRETGWQMYTPMSKTDN